ncbi:MAG: CsgG/HfaB family protein [Pseudomonadota bacterium]
MRRLAIVSAAIAAVVLCGCHKKPIPYSTPPPVTVRPTQPPAGVDYTQTLLTGKIFQKRVAVARFVDNRPVEGSPFGQKKQLDVVGPGIAIHQEELVPESDEPNNSFTPKLIDALSRTRRFMLVERKDINAILRENSFGETKWADKEKSSRVGKILGAEVIVTGSIGRNENPQTRAEGPLQLLLRMYETETGRIIGTAKGNGRTEEEMIDKAVTEIIGMMEQTDGPSK